MVTRPLFIDPRIGNDRVGLMLTREQMITIDHVRVQAQMVVDNARNILGSGSSEKSGMLGNPLTPDQKQRAHQGLWGNAFKRCNLQDIGTTDLTTDWWDYVEERIAKNHLPAPTDYYAGSKEDARWYESYFASLDGPPTYTRGDFEIWENPETGRRIHILDRHKSGISASNARTLIEARNPAWKAIVPAKLWDFYEWEYPPALRVALQVSPGPDRDPQADFPDAAAAPVGTKCVYTDRPREVFLLRDDGKWRLRTDRELGKSMGD